MLSNVQYMQFSEKLEAIRNDVPFIPPSPTPNGATCSPADANCQNSKYQQNFESVCICSMLKNRGWRFVVIKDKSYRTHIKQMTYKRQTSSKNFSVRRKITNYSTSTKNNVIIASVNQCRENQLVQSKEVLIFFICDLVLYRSFSSHGNASSPKVLWKSR